MLYPTAPLVPPTLLQDMPSPLDGPRFRAVGGAELDVARKYEEDWKLAYVETGCEAAEDAREAAEARLNEIFERISAIKPKTVADLAIVANAIKRWDVRYVWRDRTEDDELEHPQERLRDLVDCILGMGSRRAERWPRARLRKLSTTCARGWR